jgi:hypothetical protein
MSVGALDSQLFLDLPSLDSALAAILQRIGPIYYNSTRARYTEGSVGVVAKSIAIPALSGLPHLFYFKNKHKTAVLSLTMTPKTGSAWVMTFRPGSMMLMADIHTEATGGFVSLSVVSDTALTPFAAFIGD